MLNSVDFPAAQRQYYDQLFKIADVDGDGYIGLNDSAFFKKSNLPNPILGEVWQLADIRQEGRLDKEGFVIAMSLISFAQQGKRLGLEVLRTNVPPPPKMQDIPPMKQDLDWTISSQEKKQWLDIFKTNDDDGDGFITGVQARNLFGASGLPLPLLSQIWGLADINKDQRLDQHEFLVAMYLISIKRRGYEVPSVVPDVLIASAWPDPSSPTQVSIPQIAQPPQTASIPKGNEWIVPPAEKLKYDDLFKKTDTDLDGLISGEQARHLFSRSGVPMGELSRIWLLSDINQDQRLDRQEFAIAMFLIRCRLQGRDIPTPLPEALISSSRDDFVPPSPVYGSLAKDGKSRYDVNLDDVNPPNVTSPPPPSATSSMPSGIGSEGSASTPNLGSVSSLEAARRFNSTSNLHGSGTTGSQIHGSGQFLSGSAAISPAIGMSPAVSSAPAILQPGGPQFVALSPTFGSVNLVPSTALEVERTRQSIAHHERTKSELTGQLQETTHAANESVRVLEEERARADVLLAEIGELESQIGAQRARGTSYKDNITAIRLEVKNMATQKDQFEDLLTQKRLQCEDQEQILNDLRIELTEKTTEVERYQREIDQLKTRLETLRTATSDIKVQLAGAKKHITDNKSEINRLTEEVKGLKTTTSSPPLTTRAASPMSYSITPTLPALHPPVTRTTSAFLNESIPSSIASPHSHSLTSSPSTTPFSFPPPPITDTFSFDNGHEDPFAFSSKDGFGLAGVTADSFGSAAPVQTSPSPPHPTQDAPVFNDANSFFATNDAFGEAKDPFSSTGSDSANDPFASTPFPGSFDSFGAGSGSVISETGTQFIPPTPHNTIVGEKRQGALSSADIANAFSAAAFGGSAGAETTSSFFGTHDETFGASAFGNTTNDSFGGSSDAFGNTTHDTFGSTHDAFGSGGGSLRDSGGFHEGMFSTPFPPVEGKHGGVTPFPSVDQEAFSKHGGMTPFPSVDQESFAKHGGMTPYPSVDQESFAKQHGGKTPYPSVDQESFAKIHGGKTPYPSVDQESFAKMHGGKTPYPSVDQESFKQHHRSGSYPVDPDRRSGVFHAAMLESDSFAKRFSGPPKILASEDPHPFGTPADAFGNDTFGTINAFGSSEGFGTADAFGTTSAFGSSEGFGAHSTTTSDAFGSSSTDVFGNGNDVFGSGENTFGSTSSSGDMFGKADAFGKDAFGSTGFGSHSEERPVDLTSSGSVVDEAKFGDDVFGKADGFGTFNFNDKKDEFNF